MVPVPRDEMRAAVFLAPGRWEMQSRPCPDPGPGEALVRVAACGLCGTDLHIYHGRFPADFPVIPGHEFAGEVIAVGPGAAHIAAGDRVSVDPVIPDGVCDPCRRNLRHLCVNLRAPGIHLDGGFATHCVLPARQLLAIPASLGYEDAALLEPLACVLHGLDLVDIRPGDRAAIIGAGWIGLLMLQCVRLRGAARIVVSEPVAFKRERARALGADVVVDPAQTSITDAVAQTSPGGVDLAIECVGSAATAGEAVALVREGGTVLFFGVAPTDAEITVRPFDIYRRELKIVGSFSTPHKHSHALRLAAGKRIELSSLVTHRFGLDQLDEAMTSLAQGEAIKALIVPSQ
jgi:2-desacetyl-2-hydroxyethyl bacteriochlorophyllide A dehydrogenase